MTSSHATHGNDEPHGTEKVCPQADDCQYIRFRDLRERRFTGNCDEHEMLQFTVKVAMTNKDKFGKLQIYRGAGIAGMLRLLHHINYTKHETASRMQLMLDDRLLDSASRTWLAEPETTQFLVVTRTPPLTWEQLRELQPLEQRYMQTTVQQAQRRLVKHCTDNGAYDVDLTDNATFNWALFLRSSNEAYHPFMIQPGIVGCTFRLLPVRRSPGYDQVPQSECFPVFEFIKANGDRIHIRFLDRGGYLGFVVDHIVFDIRELTRRRKSPTYSGPTEIHKQRLEHTLRLAGYAAGLCRRG